MNLEKRIIDGKGYEGFSVHVPSNDLWIYADADGCLNIEFRSGRTDGSTDRLVVQALDETGLSCQPFAFDIGDHETAMHRTLRCDPPEVYND